MKVNRQKSERFQVNLSLGNGEVKLLTGPMKKIYIKTRNEVVGGGWCCAGTYN